MGLGIIIFNICIELVIVYKMLIGFTPDTPWTIYVITIGAVAGGIAAVYFSLIKENPPRMISIKDAVSIWLSSAFLLIVATYFTGALLGLFLVGIPNWISDSISSQQSCKYDENCY